MMGIEWLKPGIFVGSFLFALLGVFVLGGMAWRLVRQMNNSASKTGDQS